MANFGAALINFREWCAHTNRSWQELDYFKDILGGYQDDMLHGSWSSRGLPLKPRTINLRVAEAVNFLEWAARKGLRGEFQVPTVPVAMPARSRGTYASRRSVETINVRVGSVRTDPMLLHIPTDKEVDSWLESVRIRRDHTKWLACRLIIKTGVRREEAVQWQVDTLPLDRDDWECMGDSVLVTIKHGTKGPKSLDHKGVEIGPARQIVIPLSLALEIERYRASVRPRLRAQYVRGVKTVGERRARMEEVSTRLFLSDYTGEPLSAQRLYEAWVLKARIPYKGWSPSCGRHFWACKTLLRNANPREFAGAIEGAYGDDHSPLISSAIDTINLIIRPQLGHVDESTTHAYLVWLRRVIMLTNISDDYGRYLGDF